MGRINKVGGHNSRTEGDENEPDSSSSEDQSDDEYNEETCDIGEIERITKEVKRMKSSFEKPDVGFIIGGEQLFTHKTELSRKSPVFSALFTSDFKEKDKYEIEMPGKNLHHFLMFLRCTLDGYKDDLKDCNVVHFVIPLAHEYQVKETLGKADKFLAEQYKTKGIGKCNSGKVIEGMLEAEKYGLSKALAVLIDFASKKTFTDFSSANGYNEIPKETLHGIAMKRWKDNIDPQSGKSVTLSAPYNKKQNTSTISSSKMKR